MIPTAPANRTKGAVEQLFVYSCDNTVTTSALSMHSCVSGTVNIRTGNGTQYSRITAAKNGDTFAWGATAWNGWHAVVINGCVGWVSGKYSKAE